MIKTSLKLVINVAAAFIIFLLPSGLISSVSDAGYFAEMFVSIYIGKLLAYIISILLITFGVNKMIDSINFNK
jgi:hypothetical protein